MARLIDLKGRQYAQMNNLKAGDILEVDADFTCVDGGTHVEVKASPHGLYFACSSGRHYLDGQLDDDSDALIGLYEVGKP